MEDTLIELYEKWQKIQPLPPENYKALYQWIYKNSIHMSQTLIDNKTKNSYKPSEYEDITNHDIAFEYIQKLVKNLEPIIENNIKELNKICLKTHAYTQNQIFTGKPPQKKIIPGEYKKQIRPVTTLTGEKFNDFASPKETPLLMAELTKWMQNWLQKPKQEQQENIVAFLVALHRRFILIHPFDDGNGRVARLLLNYILLRLDFLPMVFPPGRKKYIKAIESSNEGNKEPIKKFFKDNIIFMLKKGIYAKTHKIKLTDPI